MNKFKVYDSKLLADIYNILSQIQTHIADIINSTEEIKGPEDVPPSMVPTDVLFNISTCYLAMYDKLLDNDLVKNGNFKTNQTIN